MPYTVNFQYIDKAGQSSPTVLGGSHKLLVRNAASQLDVSLVEVPNSQQPGQQGTLKLTLNSQGSGTATPRSSVAGTWPYEIYIAHQNTNGTIDSFAYAAGSHFFTVSPKTGGLAVTLDELPFTDGKTPRLLFTLRDTP